MRDPHALNPRPTSGTSAQADRAHATPTALLLEVALILALGVLADALFMVVAAIVISGFAAFRARRRSAGAVDINAWVDGFGQGVYRRFEGWGLTRKPQASDLWVAAIGVLAALAFGWIYEVVFPDPSTVDSTTASRAGAVSGHDGLLSQVLLLVVVLVFVPVVEEVAWRGHVLAGLHEVLGRYGLSPKVSATLALLVSSACFGLAHTQYNLHDQVGIAVSGAIYGLVFLKTRSVLAAALTHAAWNGWWVLAVLLSAS
ncbi:lysostaphin resistance A-like protein [Nocardioides sp. NPDC051685]|uniref:lysostaphin resistance A-like protein n=1 Tax=Nocardioides sp. NPDC051685 TaxID=3364334 RepID=UPI0037B00313